ncbi:MAG TPA: hypothetical protein VIJ85_12905, partial [Rhizomicrobium sp.]
MQKKTKDALRRADMIVASVIALSLTMAGACAAYAPSTDHIALVVPRAIVALPTAAQIAATDVAEPAPVFKQAPTESELAAVRILAQSECLADAMYYEARGEGRDGELAIA